MRFRWTSAGLNDRSQIGLSAQLDIFAIIFFPSIFFFFELGTSLAVGSVVASIFLIISCPKLKKSILISLIVVTAVLFHAFVASLFIQIDWIRLITSLLPLVLILLGGIGYGEMMLIEDENILHRSFKNSFYILSILVLNQLLFGSLWFIENAKYIKPIFPFTEPSHFALIYLPFIFYMVRENTGWRGFLIVAFGFSIGYFIESMTLLVGCMLIALIIISWRYFLILLSLVLIIATQINLDYYVARLPFEENQLTNISLLVYLQGWQLIAESMRATFGWGVGFQQLGIYMKEVDATTQIYALIQYYANILDGGFTLAKVISEFGIFGIGLVFSYFFLVKKYVLNKRVKTNSAQYIFSQAVLISFMIEIFIRGVGYFNGTSILVISAIWVVLNMKNQTNVVIRK